MNELQCKLGLVYSFIFENKFARILLDHSPDQERSLGWEEGKTAIRMLWKWWRYELPEPSQVCQKECREARVDPGPWRPADTEGRVQRLALGDYSDIAVCRKRQRKRRNETCQGGDTSVVVQPDMAPWLLQS